MVTAIDALVIEFNAPIVQCIPLMQVSLTSEHGLSLGLWPALAYAQL